MERQLHLACVAGDFAMVKRLVDEKEVDLSYRNDDVWTPLHVASENGHLDIVRWLVDEKQLDPSFQSEDGWTPLHAASENGHLDIVKWLADENQVDPSCQSEDGWTPLHVACRNGHLDIARWLVDEKQVEPSCRDWGGWTSLHWASLHDHLDIVKWLVDEKWVDPLCQDENGLTPLRVASQNGHLDIERWLANANVEKQANPLHQDNSGIAVGSVNHHTAVQIKEGISDVPVGPKLKHIKCDPTFPRVYFLDDPCLASVTSDGRSLAWDEIGIKIDIPAGAVSEDGPLKLSVRPCLSGPFSLPEDYELASPVYIISPAFDFTQDVQLSVLHYASLKCREDCSSMAFMSAKTSLAPGSSGVVYTFKVLRRGVFQEGQQFGLISLRHFCACAIGKKKRPADGTLSGGAAKRRKEDSVYSVQLYQDLTEARKHVAIVCLSLCHPVYIKNMQKCLDEWYQGVRFIPTVIQPAVISKPTVRISVPTATGGWNIASSRIPCEILKSEVDLPKSNPECGSCNYPPNIRLSISPVQHCQQQETSCILTLDGFEKDLGFTLQLPTPSLQHGTRENENTRSPLLQSSSFAEHDTVLGISDLFAISTYLLPLDHDKTVLHHLGMVLGLSYQKLKIMRDSVTFSDDLIYAWLKREDQVEERGLPTWRNLVAALKHQRVGQSGIAQKIQQEQSL